ncbi:hypothetical protein RM780_26000 [Streptomyces sp. DSM 44917]|uniref:Tat pathway signal sequence domain protein n=1 Tax=Streptomyces boetiae TaxID=3075541 RepID=A0ABU2LFT8_9ACTN|nr:hypothetical protein [Streptomyces sp. DSM 44917]MDT0310376.1 hypothetical protein [Streptomyces sp. DSM 44917]
MRRNPLPALSALALAAGLALAPPASGAAAEAGTARPATRPPAPAPALTPEHAAQLTAAMRATAEYHDPGHAEADGFVQTSDCTPGKGVHYVSAVAEGPGELAPERPNALVYDRRPDGGLVLRGVEYVSRTPATLFGREFQQSPAVGYYTLHVWLWQTRAADLFAADNPALACRQGRAR